MEIFTEIKLDFASMMKRRYLIFLLLTINLLYSFASESTKEKAIPKVNRVVPLTEVQNTNPGVFYFQNFETLSQLKSEFHDSGNLSDSIMSLSSVNSFSGKKAIKNSYIPKNRYQQGQDPGGSGWVWRFFGDNKLATNISIQDTTPHLQVFASWYHKFEEGFSSQEGTGTLPPKMARMRCFTTPWKAVYSVLFWIEGEKGFITIQQHTKAPGVEREWLPNYNTVFYLNTPENLGRWIHFELGVTLGEGRHSDRLQAWADGQLICDIANQDLAGGHRLETLNGMSWDGYWNGGSPRKQSRYFDDFVISKTLVGPARTGLNPVIEIAEQPGEVLNKLYRVQVAQTKQIPMSVNDPARKQPIMEYHVIWKGESKENRIEVNSVNGSFIYSKEQLHYNTLYSVRVQQQDENGEWSEWSQWHAAFATQYAPGTPELNRASPIGYLPGHNLEPKTN